MLEIICCIQVDKAFFRTCHVQRRVSLLRGKSHHIVLRAALIRSNRKLYGIHLAVFVHIAPERVSQAGLSRDHLAVAVDLIAGRCAEAGDHRLQFAFRKFLIRHDQLIAADVGILVAVIRIQGNVPHRIQRNKANVIIRRTSQARNREIRIIAAGRRLVVIELNFLRRIILHHNCKRDILKRLREIQFVTTGNRCIVRNNYLRRHILAACSCLFGTGVKSTINSFDLAVFFQCCIRFRNLSLCRRNAGSANGVPANCRNNIRGIVIHFEVVSIAGTANIGTARYILIAVLIVDGGIHLAGFQHFSSNAVTADNIALAVRNQYDHFLLVAAQRDFIVSYRNFLNRTCFEGLCIINFDGVASTNQLLLAGVGPLQIVGTIIARRCLIRDFYAGHSHSVVIIRPLSRRSCVHIGIVGT